VKKRRFGPTGVRLPVIGQGTWRMEGDDRARAVAALRAGLDAGMTHLDTAEVYGGGEVEEVVREAVAGRRDEVYLVSKIWPEHATYRGTVEACEASLRRLGTDRLDCYLLHWASHHPLEETVRGFEELVQAGKIRSWGVSNFDAPRLTKLLAVAGPRRIACNQVLYHLGERAIEHAVLPWCAKNDVAVVAYSPFGSGVFPSPRSAGGKLLADIAASHGATPHQVALAFLLRDAPVFTIPKASDPAHAVENAAAADLRLSPGELARIDEAFPLRARRELPMI
jgi:diketogulonate reductase-like aldo/keto reductase